MTVTPWPSRDGAEHGFLAGSLNNLALLYVSWARGSVLGRFVRRLRLVWLATGVPRKDTAPPPDLKKVTAELAAIGIDDLRLVSQTVINATAGTPFHAQCVAVLDDPCSLRITAGAPEISGEATSLDLSLEVERPTAQHLRMLCQLSSRITMQRGQYVVLGVTPTQQATSVFVVQLLPAGDKEP